jgi:uncharacterized RDD family membrane protein YckC
MLEPFIESRLATRRARLAAALLDNALLLPGGGLFVYAAYTRLTALLANPGALAATRDVGGDVQRLGDLGLFLLFVVVLVQAICLWASSQSLGKMALGIRIIRLDGRSGGLVHNVLLRVLAPSLIGALANVVPLGGLVFAVIDALLIVREDRRCIHDLIAGTVVVTTRG